MAWRIKSMKSLDIPQITVRQVNWQTDQEPIKAIRTAVFVEEQSVPEQLDFDGKDPDAYHWLAFDNNQPVGTLRMEANGKIGRMAVYQNSRAKGVGSALLRHCIQFAARQGMSDVRLHAQRNAVDFYRHFDFVIQGDSFEEAGIEHVNMVLDLGRYRHLSDKSSSELTAITSETDLFAQAAAQILDSKRHIAIYCYSLGEHLLKSHQVADALRQFALAHSQSTVTLLVSDISALHSESIAVLDLLRRLSSSMEIRVVGKELELPQAHFFLLFDNSNLIRSSDIQGVAANILTNAPADVKQLANRFNYLWQHSSTPVELLEIKL